MQQSRIGFKMFFPSVELPGIIQQQNSLGLGSMDSAPDGDVLPAVTLQIAHLLTVPFPAQNGKPAGTIRKLWPANIQKACAIGHFHHIIDMRLDAHVLVRVMKRLLRGIALPRSPGKGHA